MIVLGLFWYQNEALNKVNRLQIQYRQEEVIPCTTQHTGKLWSSSLQATVDAKSSCEFLKVVGFSCHYFFHNKLLHTQIPYPVLNHPGAQITRVWERIPVGQDPFPALLSDTPGAGTLQEPVQLSLWPGDGVGTSPPRRWESPACPAAASPALPWRSGLG